MRKNRRAAKLCISAPDLELSEHVANYLVGLELEVRVTTTFEGTRTCFSQPLLQTVHTEAILALITLQRARQYPMAYPALHILRHVLLVHHSVRVDNINLYGVLIAYQA